MKTMFTKFLFAVMFLLSAVVLQAQGTVTGTIIDAENDDALIGATILVKGTQFGTVSDFDGSFTLNKVPAGEQVIEITFVGYAPVTQTVSMTDGATVDLGQISLGYDAIGLKSVEVVASVAIDRKTPVAVTTLKGPEIEALVGNQEYVEVLRNTPSVYVTKSGGGFGDSRINVRGFDQRNTAVMINGIPVNDMENGQVYWSNWAGLSDVTSNLQVQRGLGASKLVVPSVGGSINIITNAAELEKSVRVGVNVGNDGFQKLAVALSSGLQDNGFAASLQMTSTSGDGYVEGTDFQAYSYFLSLSKQIGTKQQISLTAVGAPQWHHQRTYDVRFDNITLDTYVDADGDMSNTSSAGIKFNPLAGNLNLESFNMRRNFYHKPKVFLNHYLTINDKTSLKTSAYVSFGRGGGTGPRGRNRNGGGQFTSFSGFDEGVHDINGHIRYDDIAAYNSGQDVGDELFGIKFGATGGDNMGQNIVTNDGRMYFDENGNEVPFSVDNGTRDNGGSGFVRRASMNSHNWYGLLSTLTHELGENLNLTAGVDYRYYKGEHYRRLENLLGADAYLSKSDINNRLNYITTTAPANFGNFADNSYRTGNNILAYHNDGLVNWLGGFAQLEYSKDNLTIFGAVSGSNQAFKRIDYFNYLDSDPEQTTDWQSFLGGNAKAGINYNIDAHQNIFANGGYISQQPIFDNVFQNFRNDINPDIKNQTITSFEIGYGLRFSKLRANLNLYNTIWENRQFNRGLSEDVLGPDGEIIEQSSVLAIFDNVGEVHRGIEVDFTYYPVRKLQIEGMASIGDWFFNQDFTATKSIVDAPQGSTLLGETTSTLYADGLKVGDAAQTTFSLGARYEIIDGLRLRASWYTARNLYAEFDIFDDSFFAPDPEVVQLPAYSLVDAGISYKFDMDNYDVTARLNMNNVLNTTYIAELDTNVQDDPDTKDVNEFYTQNKGFYGFGRTWNVGLKFNF